jgi:hypothetical protein
MDLRSRYETDGWAGPIRALDDGEAARRWAGIAEALRAPVAGSPRRNRHLDLAAVAGICGSDVVRDVVTAVLGPDVLLWRTHLLTIGRSQRMGVRWHQDSYLNLLDTRRGEGHCSVQLAFTPSTRRNCVHVVPGSHRWSEEDLARRGWRVVPGSAEGPNGTPNWGLPPGVRTRPVPLAAGELYVFHPLLLHASLAGTRLAARDASRTRRVRFLARWWLRALPELLWPPADRCSLALRFCRPDVGVRPAAYAESPTRDRPVVVAGSNAAGRNQVTTLRSPSVRSPR